MPVPHDSVRAFLPYVTYYFTMTPEQQQLVNASLREGESLLYAATCGTAAQAPVVAAKPKSSFWARLLGKKNVAPATPVAVASQHFFAITSKRVLLFNGSAEPRVWFFMLGMIQQFVERDNGMGDIIFENELTPAGERIPLGLMNIADAERVHNLLRSAIDEDYMSSPWSV